MMGKKNKKLKTKKFSRREFIKTTATTAAGVTTGAWFLDGVAPAFAQKRTLTSLALSLFVPAGDEMFKQIMAEFGKQAGCDTRFDTVQTVQVPPKVAAEAAAGAGHDLWNIWEAYGYLHRQSIIDLDDVIDPIDKAQKIFDGPRECHFIEGRWKLAPYYFFAMPQNVNIKHWKDAGLEIPTTWAELHERGKLLKTMGHPIGIAISQKATDGNHDWWTCLWCFGGKVFEEDNKTIAINSLEVKNWLEFSVALYKDCMTPEVLTWDDAGNNRFLLSGKGSWCMNPISIWNAARTKKMPIAKYIKHFPSLSGPAGRHNATFNHGWAITKFSKNQELAKDFLRYFFQPENYGRWVRSVNGYVLPTTKTVLDNTMSLWTDEPDIACLPDEAPYVHSQGWPGNPTQYVAAFNERYMLAQMVHRCIEGQSPASVAEWAEKETQKIAKETV
jgi:multiple sugar transport system substrate-binding protein